MIEEIKPRTLRALACDIEDCHNPQSWADYCRAAANRIEAQATEITRLRAELATARREGMEEAAKISAEFDIVANLHGPWIAAAIRAAAKEVNGPRIAAAIRAAAGEGK